MCLAHPVIAIADLAWPWIALSGMLGFGRPKIVILLVGLLVLALGLILAKLHHHKISALQSTKSSDDQDGKFELRKQSRRLIVGYLIVCLGIVMSGCYWIHESIAFAIMLGVMMLLVLAITILAYVDMASIGVKLGLEKLTASERDADAAIHQAIAKHKSEQQSGDSESTAEN